MKPFPRAVELLVADAVKARASLLFVRQEPSLFQNAQVPAGRRPRTAKAAGDLAGRHAAAAKLDHQENVPSRRMGESGEDLLKFLKPLARVKFLHVIR